jgi:hypothetical protein
LGTLVTQPRRISGQAQVRLEDDKMCYKLPRSNQTHGIGCTTAPMRCDRECAELNELPKAFLPKAFFSSGGDGFEALTVPLRIGNSNRGVRVSWDGVLDRAMGRFFFFCYPTGISWGRRNTRASRKSDANDNPRLGVDALTLRYCATFT